MLYDHFVVSDYGSVIERKDAVNLLINIQDRNNQHSSPFGERVEEHMKNVVATIDITNQAIKKMMESVNG